MDKYDQLRMEGLAGMEPQPFSVLEGGTSTEKSYQIKCFQNQLQSIEYLTREMLFSGFNKIQAITFSYDIGFINSIVKSFDYAEIILGGNFMVQKDERMKNYLVEVFVQQEQAVKTIRKNEQLVAMMREGDVVFRTPEYVLDHRKIYLLSADDGRTRVITTSANMTGRAWNGEQMEFYEYDDSETCYQAFKNDFETAWNNSSEIPFSLISVKKKESNDLKDVPLITKIKEMNEVYVLKETESKMLLEKTQYVIDHEKIVEKYKEILSNMTIKPTSSGLIEVTAKDVMKIERQAKSYFNRQMKQQEKVEDYPSLHIDYGDLSVYLNDEKLDLDPAAEEVRRDIETLQQMFKNFDDFIPNPTKLKENHYKLMNLMFASPFNAKLRCVDKWTERTMEESLCLPMFLLLASTTANCGKTFAVRTFLKMMTGKRLHGINKVDCKKNNVRAYQVGCKSVPIFVDEIDNRFFGFVKDLIKASSNCENNFLEEQPMIIFASNDVIEPDETLRKRMAFLRYEGALPSTVDQSAYKGKGSAILKNMGTAFYRVYLSKMIGPVKEWIDEMTEGNLSASWYPDLMSLSSNIIRQIFEDYGYPIPLYAKELSWNDDFSQNASYISEGAVREICELYKTNRKAFSFTKEKIIIDLGNDQDSKKRYTSWQNTLPQEMEAKGNGTRDGFQLVLNRAEFEKRCGFKLRKKLFQ